MNHRRFAAIGLLVGSALLLGAAPQEPRAPATRGDQCFRADQVNGYNAVGNAAVDVSVGPRRTFRLTMMGTCRDLAWSERLAVRARSGSGWICAPIDAEVVVPTDIGPDRCQVTEIRLLGPNERPGRR